MKILPDILLTSRNCLRTFENIMQSRSRARMKTIETSKISRIFDSGTIINQMYAWASRKWPRDTISLFGLYKRGSLTYVKELAHSSSSPSAGIDMQQWTAVHSSSHQLCHFIKLTISRSCNNGQPVLGRGRRGGSGDGGIGGEIEKAPHGLSGVFVRAYSLVTFDFPWAGSRPLLLFKDRLPPPGRNAPRCNQFGIVRNQRRSLYGIITRPFSARSVRAGETKAPPREFPGESRLRFLV